MRSPRGRAAGERSRSAGYSRTCSRRMRRCESAPRPPSSIGSVPDSRLVSSVSVRSRGVFSKAAAGAAQRRALDCEPREPRAEQRRRQSAGERRGLSAAELLAAAECGGTTLRRARWRRQSRRTGSDRRRAAIATLRGIRRRSARPRRCSRISARERAYSATLLRCYSDSGLRHAYGIVDSARRGEAPEHLPMNRGRATTRGGDERQLRCAPRRRRMLAPSRSSRRRRCCPSCRRRAAARAAADGIRARRTPSKWATRRRSSPASRR